MKRHILATAAAGLAIVLVAGQPRAQNTGGLSAPTPDDGHPPEVSFATTGLGPLYVDAHGMTLYVLDSSVALFRAVNFNAMKFCSDACAKTWIALKAPPGAKPIGAWKVVDGAEGPQWAYKGNPVFTYVGDTTPGATTGHRRDELFAVIEYVPPVPKMKAPPTVTAVFVDHHYILEDNRGHALFTSRKPGACDTSCRGWSPLTAGLASQGLGDWTVSRDGDRAQWVYRGQLVFVSEESPPTGAPEGAVVLQPDIAPAAGKSERVAKNE